MSTAHTQSEQFIEQLDDDALLLEPRDVFDTCIVGVTDSPDDHWPRQRTVTVAVYDKEMCVHALMDWLGSSHTDASEYFEYNTAGAWMGEGTPTFTDQDS